MCYACPSVYVIINFVHGINFVVAAYHIVGNTPKSALDIILCLLPLQKYIVGVAATNAMRLLESAVLRPRLYGHTRLLNECVFQINSNSEDMSAYTPKIISGWRYF